MFQEGGKDVYTIAVGGAPKNGCEPRRIDRSGGKRARPADRPVSQRTVSDKEANGHAANYQTRVSTDRSLSPAGAREHGSFALCGFCATLEGG